MLRRVPSAFAHCVSYGATQFGLRCRRSPNCAFCSGIDALIRSRYWEFMDRYLIDGRLSMRSAIFCSMLCVSCICYFLTGCGGGGGGSDVEDFSGVWSGNAALVDDTCGAISTDQQFIFFTHLVNQNEVVIALDNGFLAFTGAVQSEAGSARHRRTGEDFP